MGVHSHFPRRRSKPSSSVRHSEPPLQFQAFKATIFIGLQSHSPYRRSEPPLSRIGVQSHHFHRRSEPPFFFIGVQSHHHSHIGIQSHKASKPFPPQAFKAISLQSHSSHRFSEPRFPFIGVRSHLAQFYFLSQAFKAFVLDRRSEPQTFRATSPTQEFKATLSPRFRFQSHRHLSNLDVQSHFSVQAFRATIFLHSHLVVLGVQSHLFQFRRSEPFILVQTCSPTILGIQSHLLQLQAFRGPFFSLGIQSHLAQFKRLEPLLQFRRSEPPSTLGVKSHLFQFRHSEPCLLA